MKTTYHTPSDNANSLIEPPHKLECLIIRNYSTKYNRVFKVLKEFLDSTPNITKYCKIKPEYPVRSVCLSKWQLYRVKPENIYVFTHCTDYSRFIVLLKRMRSKHRILCDYIITPTFYLKSYDYPLEYYSTYGTLLIDKEYADIIME